MAYSGGPDSTVLLHLLVDLSAELEIRLGAAHLHHGLRDVEADEDLEHCRTTAAAWGVPFYSAQVSIENRDQSLQGAAREAREAFLREIAAENGYDCVATGHNADDVIETLLFRISRGTGIHGLAGIPARRGIFVRPLLPFRRSQLIEYAEQNHLKYREDSSNLSLKYTRNLIRHKVLPTLYKELGDSLADNLLRLADQARLEDDALAAWAEDIVDSLLDTWKQEKGVMIDAAGLSVLPKAIRIRVIASALRRVARFEITSRHLEICDRVLGPGHPVRRAVLPGSISLRRVGDRAWLAHQTVPGPFPEPFDAVNLQVPGLTELPSGWGKIDVYPSDGFQKCSLSIDPSRIQGKLAARPVKYGDRYMPIGEDKECKVKKLFERLSVSVEDRVRCVLLMDEEGIVGGRGLPVADRVATVDPIKSLLCVSFH